MADINIPDGPIEREPFDSIRATDGERLDDAERQALMQTLDGLPLGAYDLRIVDWLATWEPSTVATVCSWIRRARAQGGGGHPQPDRLAVRDGEPLGIEGELDYRDGQDDR